ncbi:hypothetical protein ABUK73_05795 [Agrobacterium sp. BA1120]|uniref:hypothetical protein n=1 Tax=Agrobacterium sp. BA1120 TaxID=3228927 RepID=UPI00336A1E80
MIRTIFWIVILTASASAAVAIYMPNSVINLIGSIEARVVLFTLSWLLLLVLGLYIYWFYFDLKPVRVTAGICKTLTAILFFSASASAFGMPQISSIKISDNSFYMDIVNSDTKMHQVAMCALFGLLVSGLIFILAYYIEKKTVS